ncbi:MAG: DUF2062 domain-containing protein [Vicinamibacterales bacterium]
MRYRLIIPVFRSTHPPEYTARGVAIGIFWAIVPVVGLQTLCLLATWAILSRTRYQASLVQALAWHWVNNFFTFVPILYLCYATGQVLMGHVTDFTGYAAFVDLVRVLRTSSGGWMGDVATAARVLGVPALVGSLPWAAGGGLAGFAWSRALVRHHRAARASRRAARTAA